MSKKKKITVIVSATVVGVLAVVLTGLMFTGYFVGWGPFADFANIRYGRMEGNSDTYSVENVEVLQDSPLNGKNIGYLGSSVTYGADALQTSFVEYIAKRNNTTYVKEAVSGTTLVDNGSKSYVSRLKTIDASASFDLFVCQLSTNDAAKNYDIGTVGDGDTSTVCGAIEYIIDYVQATWNCPVIFYTNCYYESEAYGNMVSALYEIVEEHSGVGIIDLFTDTCFNDITDEQRDLYMADKIHPTKAGYLEWWTPKMEKALYNWA